MRGDSDVEQEPQLASHSRRCTELLGCALDPVSYRQQSRDLSGTETVEGVGRGSEFSPKDEITVTLLGGFLS